MCDRTIKKGKCMNELLRTLFKRVLEINETELHDAHFRYVKGDLAVDVWNSQKQNIYHNNISAADISHTDGEAIASAISHLNYLLTEGFLRAKSYRVEFEDMFIKIDTPCSTHSEAINTVNQLNEKYDIKCVITEIYI